MVLAPLSGPAKMLPLMPCEMVNGQGPQGHPHTHNLNFVPDY